MDIGRSFTYVLDDDEWWKKVLLGGLLSLIPIVGPLYAIGYVLEVISNVIGGRETPLPEAVENFIYDMEKDEFRTWEAVIREEHPFASIAFWRTSTASSYFFWLSKM